MIIKFLAKIGMLYSAISNGKLLIRIFIGVSFFFITENIYLKWSSVIEDLSPFFSILLLSIYTFVQLIIILWIYFSFNKFSRHKKIKHRILSISNDKNENEFNFEKYKDLKRYPNLKKIEVN